jgi:hypothetical protein
MSEKINKKEENDWKKYDVNDTYEKYIRFNITIGEKAKPYILLSLLECSKDSWHEGFNDGKKNERIRHTNWLKGRMGKLLEILDELELTEKDKIYERIKRVIDSPVIIDCPGRD